jgi:hypothetical protein
MSLISSHTYVDDAFSYELADQFTFYAPYQKQLPSKQARLLTLFDEVRIPHDEPKQVFGSPLTIIGFSVDPNAMTITMAADARTDLVTTIREFAGHRHRSLKDFQRLTGWVTQCLSPSLTWTLQHLRKNASWLPSLPKAHHQQLYP